MLHVAWRPGEVAPGWCWMRLMRLPRRRRLTTLRMRDRGPRLSSALSLRSTVTAAAGRLPGSSVKAACSHDTVNDDERSSTPSSSPGLFCLTQTSLSSTTTATAISQGGNCLREGRRGICPGHRIPRYGTKGALHELNQMVNWAFVQPALNDLFCADVLRTLDLVPLTDFTYKDHPAISPYYYYQVIVLPPPPPPPPLVFVLVFRG